MIFEELSPNRRIRAARRSIRSVISRARFDADDREISRRRVGFDRLSL